MPGHGRPLELLGLTNVPGDEAAQPGFAFSRKHPGQQHYRAQRAGLAVDRVVGPIDVAPHLGRDEGDEEPENDSQRGQQPGRDALERAGPLPNGERHDQPVDRCRRQVGAAEDHDPHSAQRKCV
jgi:hypothetical protein